MSSPPPLSKLYSASEPSPITELTGGESAELLAVVSDAIPALISYLTPDARYKFCNRAYTEWFGVRLEQIIGRPVVEIVGEAMWRASEPRFKQALAGQTLNYEVEAPYTHGPRRWVHVSYTPHRLYDGTIAGVVAMVSDITTRKGAEESARAAEERMQLAMSIADAGTWDLDLITGKLYWSDSHFRMLGVEPTLEGEATMAMWQERVPPEDFARLTEEWERAKRERDRLQCEYRMRKSDDRLIWVRAAGSFVYNERGEAARFLGVFFDITAAKEAEERLEQLVRDRTAALQVKLDEMEAFSYSLSHDLRGPLRSMYGFTKILLADHAQQLDSEAQDYLRRIERGAERLDQLVRDVLAYSKVAKEEFALVPIDLSTVMADVVQSFDTRSARLQIESPLPKVLGHEALLFQIFANLLDNAVKFSRRDEPAVVRVYAQTEGAVVRVFIEDEGIGIAPQHFQRIFEIFGRVHGDNVYQGTGIGLAIVSKAAERLGGRVGVESRLERGARFWVELRAVAA